MLVPFAKTFCATIPLFKSTRLFFRLPPRLPHKHTMATATLNDAILQHLTGPSDEHRVVGLLMLTKHITLHPTNIASLRQSVFTTLDAAFLRRLLLTEAKVGDSATDELALGMLAFFCQGPPAMPLSYLDTMPVVCRKWAQALSTMEASSLSTRSSASSSLSTAPWSRAQ